MTRDQATAVRVQWEQREIHLRCAHLDLELELNDLGDPTGNYVCILCGESVAHRKVDVEAGTLPTSQVDPPCSHYQLRLECTPDGRLTHTYRCLECGRPYATNL
jgi:DNA-directed RNA polymerase subunit RPC12/RpoP